MIFRLAYVHPALPQLKFIEELDLNIPFILFLIACFGSAWIAILAVRPAIRPWKSDAPRKLFFKDYKNIELPEFQEFIGEVIKSGDSIYSTLNTDMYLFGKTIVRKYDLLRNAYTIFMIGLAGMVVSFLVIRLVQ
ncbi:hypothetical protein ES708_05689 [subsurface metagenome]